MAHTLYQGDCLEILKGLADNSVDAVITDPPYLTTDIYFDKKGFNINEFCLQTLRVLKPNGYLASFGSVELFAVYLNFYKTRFTGVWLKQAAVMRTSTAKKPMGRQEPYAVFCKKNANISELTWNKVKKYGYSTYSNIKNNAGFKRGGKDSLSRACTSAWTKDGFVQENKDGSRFELDVIEGNNKCGMSYSERTIHPTQKPVNVFEVLIGWLTNKGDTVLDCFMGSGTTGIACANTGRNFIGMELDPEYFALSQERIAHANFGDKGEIIANEPLPIRPKLQPTLF